MTTPVIQVENLSKAYRIGLKEEIPDTITGALVGWIKAPLRNLERLRRLNTFQKSLEQTVRRPGSAAERAEDPSAIRNPQSAIQNYGHSTSPPDNGSTDTLWALKDVSFAINEGEVVGIVGRNGAGKSTLLKVLSRITDPTHGRVTIRGRVSSLLEVGTGFHPELSGRENIYMNGTILGMRKREIDGKFDEIVEFSGVEKFLDTPIKRYSSGMQVRLAFAVAAHLEPEILIIDEVLAVGDAEFQNKCLGKMQDVARSGRTVLFVSHDLSAIQRMCSRCMQMELGTNNPMGSASEVIDDYLRSTDQPKRSERLASNSHVTAVTVEDANGIVGTVPTGCRATITVDLRDHRALPHCNMGIIINDMSRRRLMVFHTEFHGNTTIDKLGNNRIVCDVPCIPLLPGDYQIDVVLGDAFSSIERIECATVFHVVFHDYLGTGHLPSKAHGYFALPCSWR